MEKPLIIALDFSNRKQVSDFLDAFKEEELFLKVGMELFYSEGPDIIPYLKSRGHRIFLDLKLHDIPNTVYRAMTKLSRLGCDLVNVHAAGGSEMMRAAIEGLDAGTLTGKKRPQCIAVTQLTSTSEEQLRTEQLISYSVKESVLHYADLSKDSGMDGVVCSALEAHDIRLRLGEGFMTVVPGIRLSSDGIQDQVRVATPQFAKEVDVSAIVVGRPITASSNPCNAYHSFKDFWQGGKK